MTLFFDLDGVIRNLSTLVWDEEEPNEWNEKVNGISIMDTIDNNLDLLVKAPPTKYYPIIKQLPYINILTAQPMEWRPYTVQWVKNHFEEGTFNIIFVEEFPEKEDFIYSKIGRYLIDDFPYFKNTTNIICLTHPYNKEVDCPLRINTIEDMKNIIDLFY